MAILIGQGAVSVPCVTEIILGAGLVLADLGRHRAGITGLGAGPPGPQGRQGIAGPPGPPGPPGGGGGPPTGAAGGVLAGTYPDPAFARPPAFTDGPNLFAADQGVAGQVSAWSFRAAGAVPGVLPGFIQLLSGDSLGGLAPYGFVAPAGGTGVPGGVMWTLPAADAAGALTSDGGGNLTFSPGGGAPAGPAGGDLGGTFPAPEVLNVDGGTWS